MAASSNPFIMALWHDEKYLRLVSPQLEAFKPKHEHTYNFRCPLCGDSDKSKTKARGYVFPLGQKLMFKCHNCSVSLPFSNLLKRLSPGLWNDYLFETLDESRKAPEPAQKPTQQPAPSRIPRATNLSPLSAFSSPESPLHAVWQFATKRLLPEVGFTRLFATNKAHTWVLPLVGEDKASKVQDGPPYLVQPLRFTNGDWYGAQLRDLRQKAYVTFRWGHETLKVFGLEAWKPAELTYLIEGPMDALFVPNSIAACGADLLSAARHLEEDGLMNPRADRVFVWDNEPRNHEVSRHIRTAISLGEAVVIWPKGYPKDVNDMVKAGIPVREVLDTITARTYRGLMAELEYEQWKA